MYSVTTDFSELVGISWYSKNHLFFVTLYSVKDLFVFRLLHRSCELQSILYKIAPQINRKSQHSSLLISDWLRDYPQENVECLPLVQQVRGSIPGGVVIFNSKILNLGARRGGDVHFLIPRLYITVLD